LTSPRTKTVKTDWVFAIFSLILDQFRLRPIHQLVHVFIGSPLDDGTSTRGRADAKNRPTAFGSFADFPNQLIVNLFASAHLAQRSTNVELVFVHDRILKLR